MLKLSLKRGERKWLLDVAIIFFISALLLVCAYLIFEKVFEYKIYPRTYLGNYNLSNKTVEEAKKIINQKADEINQQGIVFLFENHQTTIYPVVASVEGDLAYWIISFNTEEAAENAFNLGRNNNFFINLNKKIKASIFKKQIILPTKINQKEIKKILKEKFSQFEMAAKNAEITTGQNNDPNFSNFQISEEKLGKIIDYEKGINDLYLQLANLNSAPIKLNTITEYPEIYKRDCLNIEAKAKTILNLAPLVFKYNEKEWIVEEKKLTEWLTLEIEEKTLNQDKVTVSINQNKAKNFLESQIAAEINQEPINAKFELKNDRVIEFQTNRDGLKLNLEATLNKLKEEAVKNKKNEIDIVVEILESEVNTENINNLGIKNIIGTGQSNFAGSPTNRRHNIKVGADSLNGLLIKPDQEFSLNKALGKIDDSTGYLPELVIKENKTIPEYGGGLCQIGTTIFRTVLASGLPVTMRRNHSYRVSYYEPAGTDATIYDPWPDFKFINDTKNYILIQSRLEGDQLYFDFWGTKDGRIVEQNKPVIYNIVKPGPTKYIETLELPIGEEKCTEKAHNGADAYFDYKVTYASGELREEKFTSHYVPWQEVCLIGVEKLSPDSENATSTSLNIN